MITEPSVDFREGRGEGEPTRDPLSIFCVITALECGGAERQLVHLVNLLARRGHRVQLHVLHGQASFFQVDDRVDLRFWELESSRPSTAIGRFRGRVRWLRDNVVAAGPDLVLSFIDVANATTLLATRSLEVPVIVSERSHPPAHRIPLRFTVLRRFLYPGATRVVVQTAGTARWARSWLLEQKVVTIPNPVVVPASCGTDRSRTLLPPGGRWLVAMGRLEHLKGFDVLLSAFASISDDHPEWRLVVLGEGPERAALENEAIRLGLDRRVLLPGVSDAPETVLKQCEVFILSSRYEGFPNALCEAMACGLAVVSSDCPEGPGEIIRDDLDGILVPPDDPDALAEALSKIMSDGDYRLRLAARAAEVVTRFDEQTIFETWETLLREVVAATGTCE